MFGSNAGLGGQTEDCWTSATYWLMLSVPNEKSVLISMKAPERTTADAFPTYIGSGALRGLHRDEDRFLVRDAKHQPIRGRRPAVLGLSTEARITTEHSSLTGPDTDRFTLPSA